MVLGRIPPKDAVKVFKLEVCRRVRPPTKGAGFKLVLSADFRVFKEGWATIEGERLFQSLTVRPMLKDTKSLLQPTSNSVELYRNYDLS